MGPAESGCKFIPRQVFNVFYGGLVIFFFFKKKIACFRNVTCLCS